MEKEYNIYDIVTELIGEIKPVGETNTDEKRYRNLLKFISLYEEMQSDLARVSEYSERVEFSMKKAGELAKEVINH